MFSSWIAVDQGGVVSKIDTRTGGSWTVLYCIGAVGSAGSSRGRNRLWARPRRLECLWACNSCNRGSRTAVLKGSGDVFIANRAFSYQGTITKIANLERDCIDLNGNGVIDTARDHNENGIIDMTVGAGEKQEYFAETTSVSFGPAPHQRC